MKARTVCNFFTSAQFLPCRSGKNDLSETFEPHFRRLNSVACGLARGAISQNTVWSHEVVEKSQRVRQLDRGAIPFVRLEKIQ